MCLGSTKVIGTFPFDRVYTTSYLNLIENEAISYHFRDIISYFPNIKEVKDTPLSGTISRSSAGTCYDQHAHQI